MIEKKILLDNLDKIHTTPMGLSRIKNNLKLYEELDIILHCKNIIINEDSKIILNGKNYYVYYNNIKITINKYSYTIITAHLI